MKICALSDTHGYHRQVKIPSGVDLILFAGDISNQGEDHILRDFNVWLGELGVPAIVVAGNHDLTLDNNYYLAKQVLSNAIYLEHELVEFNGVKIFGSPYSPKLGWWGFGLTKDEAEHKWSQLPEDTDIVMSHGPMFGFLDKLNRNGNHVGCKKLRKHIRRVKPKYLIVGHIHEEHGYMPGDTQTYNVSICDWPDCEPTYSPTIIEI